MRVLGIGAHPDDCEMYCGGTLAKYARLGHEVFICVATNGEVGNLVLNAKETVEARRKEAKAATDLIGAELLMLDFQDQAFLMNMEARDAFIDVLRYVQPDVVFTHYPDLHCSDHYNVGRLANDVIFMPKCPNIKTKHPAITNDLPVMYFFDTPGGIGFEPDEYVDITEDMETKRKLIKCHASQDKYMEDNYGRSLTDVSDIVAAFRGNQVGVTYAEGFIRVKIWGRNRPGTLLP